MFAIRDTISSSCWYHVIPKFKKNTEKMQERCRIANMENTFCEKLVFVGSMELARVLRHRHRGGHLHEDVDDDGKRTMKEMIY